MCASCVYARAGFHTGFIVGGGGKRNNVLKQRESGGMPPPPPPKDFKTSEIAFQAYFDKKNSVNFSKY